MGPQPPEFDKDHPMESKILRMRVMGPSRPVRNPNFTKTFWSLLEDITFRQSVSARQPAASQPAIYPPASQPAAKPASQAASSQPEASHPTSRQPELMLPKLDTLTWRANFVRLLFPNTFRFKGKESNCLFDMLPSIGIHGSQRCQMNSRNKFLNLLFAHRFRVWKT